MFMIGFVAGIFFGGFITLAVVSVLAVASKWDRWEEMEDER